MPTTSGKPLLELATAYNSLRDSGFDFSTAVGEPIDNAIQAQATKIEIITKTVEKDNPNSKKKLPVIQQVAIIDNGYGMNADVLHSCLQLGYSTRYNDREGIGRFGVGATLAAISQCKKITVFSRDKSTGNFLSTYIDIDEIAKKDQLEIPYPVITKLPLKINPLINQDSGTIIVWDKCDRLETDPNGKPISSKLLLDELEEWVSRAYKYFLWDRREIYLNGKPIIAHDPLYLNPKGTRFSEDEPAKVEFSHKLEWQIPSNPNKTSEIQITLTLLPESLRSKRGAGGEPPATERRIDKNEGISLLRHKREVAFGNFYPMLPSVIEIDRWWGCEINFEPDLDECWEIRNVKRGARPIAELREAIKKLLSKKVLDLRKEIQEYWKRVDAANAQEKGVHTPAEDIVKEVEKTVKPAVQAGKILSTEQKEDKRREVIEDPELPEYEKTVLRQKVAGPSPLPISIKSKAMAGAEFMETDHIGNGQIVLTFNKKHPFFSEIYNKLEELEQSTDENTQTTALVIRYAIDLLLMAYGRAESMIDLDNPTINEVMTELRSYWGVQLRKYIKKLADDQ
ncbi:MAG: ATP-binding protein [Nostoc sp. JL31]|uniref:ATP-binding protein n=1 Tax=Nostoc sp. JL31 TaxID=2815395 RepID=UPI0025CBBE1E|nr:ATP-binding protein [Nostoc sp. JL31]MBN3890405.1 ATP-binding protein [Nostoc sp. JL31]